MPKVIGQIIAALVSVALVVLAMAGVAAALRLLASVVSL